VAPNISSSFKQFWQYDGDFIAHVAKQAIDWATDNQISGMLIFFDLLNQSRFPNPIND